MPTKRDDDLRFRHDQKLWTDGKRAAPVQHQNCASVSVNLPTAKLTAYGDTLELAPISDSLIAREPPAISLIREVREDLFLTGCQQSRF